MSRPSEKPTFWIGEKIEVVIDRPLGSRHPRFPSMLYPVNYGYVPGTRVADGHALDAYLLGVHFPVKSYAARCVGIIHRHDDIEDKLVLAPDGYVVDEGAILSATHFQEKFFTIDVIMDFSVIS